MKMVFALLVPAVSLAMPVAAQTTEAPVPVVKKAPKPKKICRETDTTNTRISKTICKTAEEWANEPVRDVDGVTGNRKTQ